MIKGEHYVSNTAVRTSVTMALKTCIPFLKC